MAELATIARPYAKALFELATKENALESWLTELDVLATVVLQEKVVALVEDPELDAKHKSTVLLSLLDHETNVELKNFVSMLAEYKRLLVLPEIYRQFQQLVLSKENTKVAVIYTAYPLTEKQFSQVLMDIEHHFHMKLKAEQVVDAELIGGIKVEVGDQILDLSVQGRLNGLHAALLN